MRPICCALLLLSSTCAVSLGAVRQAAAQQRPITSKETAAAARRAQTEACAAGSGSACSELGLMLAQTPPATLAPEEEIELAKLACSAGVASTSVLKTHHYACVVYGNALWDGHVVALDRKLAVQVLSGSCEDSLAPKSMQSECHLRVARASRDGEGVPADLQVAAAHFSRACVLTGGADTCFESAEACDDALFRYERNGDNEAECYVRACDVGSAQACARMGAYYNGSEQWEKAGSAYGNAVALGMESERPHLLAVSSRLAKQRDVERRQAERSLPRLFAKCERNKTKVERLRVALFAARASGDIKAMKKISEALDELNAPWSEDLGALRASAELAADGQSEKLRALLLTVDERCNCRPTTTGHCRECAAPSLRGDCEACVATTFSGVCPEGS
jgi:TPR repeat protein